MIVFSQLVETLFLVAVDQSDNFLFFVVGALQIIGGDCLVPSDDCEPLITVHLPFLPVGLGSNTYLYLYSNTQEFLFTFVFEKYQSEVFVFEPCI